MPGSFRIKSRRAAFVSVLAVAATGVPAARAESTTVIGGGFAHTCALIFDGTARCWGNNSGGQLGIKDTAEPRVSPVTAKRLRNAISLTVGESFDCALIRGGSVACWGSDISEELGDGKIAHSRGVAPVPGVQHAIAVSAGSEHACALRSGGTVLCWGNNEHGQLGIGGVPHDYPAVTGPMPPVQVPGLTTAIAISAGWDQTCALLAGGTVDCWGLDSNGERGPGGYPVDEHVVPTPVPGLSGAVAIDAGNAHACALIEDGTVKCWGYTAFDVLGDGTMDAGFSPPVTAIGVTHAVAVAADGHTCALIADGTVDCWGGNSRGQLGLGTTTFSYPAPTRVHGIANAVAVGVGNNHACATLATGDVKCWGENLSGQIGNGRRRTAQTLPALVRGVNGSAAGAFHSCGSVGSVRVFSAGHTTCARARAVLRRYRAHRRVRGWRCAASGRSVRCRRGSTASQVGWTR